MYNWHDVAERTERVYDKVMGKPAVPLVQKLHNWFRVGMWFGKILCVGFGLVCFWWLLWGWLEPACQTERAFEFPHTKLRASLEKKTEIKHEEEQKHRQKSNRQF